MEQIVFEANFYPKEVYDKVNKQEAWYKDRILNDGRLSDLNTTSEYERGFIDCWNELWKYSLYV